MIGLKNLALGRALAVAGLDGGEPLRGRLGPKEPGH